MYRKFLRGLIVLVSIIGLTTRAHLAYATTVIDLWPAADVAEWWVPSDPGAVYSHYTLVDEIGCDTQTFVYDTTPDAFNEIYRIDLSSIPAYSTITKIEIAPCASALYTSGTNSVLEVHFNYDGVHSPARKYVLSSPTLTILPSSVWDGYEYIREPWSELSVYLRNADGTKGVKVSDVKVRITYF